MSPGSGVGQGRSRRGWDARPWRRAAACRLHRSRPGQDPARRIPRLVRAQQVLGLLAVILQVRDEPAARNDDQASQPPPSPRSGSPGRKEAGLARCAEVTARGGKIPARGLAAPSHASFTLATGSVRSNRQKDRARWPPRHRARAGRQPRRTWPALLASGILAHPAIQVRTNLSQVRAVEDPESGKPHAPVRPGR